MVPRTHNVPNWHHLFLLAVGPDKLGAWRSRASDWWNSDALLQAENEQLKRDKKELKERLSTYEDRDTTKVVAGAENGGPVVLDVAHENRGPSHCRVIRHEGGGESMGGRSYDTFLVPYKSHNSVLTALDEPAVAVEIEGVDDVFLVAVTYEARSTEKGSESKGFEEDLGALFAYMAGSAEKPPASSMLRPETSVWLQVLDDDKHLVREPKVHTGPGDMIQSEQLWEHAVSSSYILSGLPKGVYGLNVYEEMDRSMGTREYLNMRLTVTKLFSATAPQRAG